MSVHVDPPYTITPYAGPAYQVTGGITPPRGLRHPVNPQTGTPAPEPFTPAMSAESVVEFTKGIQAANAESNRQALKTALAAGGIGVAWSAYSRYRRTR